MPNSTVKVYTQNGRSFAVRWNGERFVTEEATENARVNASSYLFEIFEVYLCGLHFKTAEEHENLPHKGDVVRVLNNRKNLRAGTEGTIFWTKENRYGILCMVRTTDQKNEKGKWQDVFGAYADNLERVS